MITQLLLVYSSYDIAFEVITSIFHTEINNKERYFLPFVYFIHIFYAECIFDTVLISR